MSESLNLTIKLHTPITHDGAVVDSLTLSELTVDETIMLEKQHGSKPNNEQDKYFFALSCGVQPDVIGKLKSRDWTRLKARYWETLGNVAQELGSSE